MNYINIAKDQWLSDIQELYPLPTNTIIHKTLPGLGATHGEINAPRHSIIILPSVPIIMSKVEKHNDKANVNEQILGIHKCITVSKVEDYLTPM